MNKSRFLLSTLITTIILCVFSVKDREASKKKPVVRSGVDVTGEVSSEFVVYDTNPTNKYHEVTNTYFWSRGSLQELELRVAELERQSENNGNLAARGLALTKQNIKAIHHGLTGDTNGPRNYWPVKSNGLWIVVEE